jgi:hypothetical protein
MDTESVVTQAPKPFSVPPKPNSSGTLFIVFKYVAIGMGILGVGLLIAIGGFLLRH